MFEAMYERLCRIISEQFDVDMEDISMKTLFVDDLNADSVDLVDLAMALEEEFDLEEIENVDGIQTVGDLYHYIQDHADV